MAKSPSPETRAKISAKLMGHPGHEFTQEERQRISASRMGHAVSDETRRKISEAKMGHPVSAETRGKIAAKARGQVLSADAKQRIADGVTKSWKNAKTRERRIAGLRNIPRSLQTRDKQSTIMKVRYSDQASRRRIAIRIKEWFANPESKRKWLKCIQQVRAKASQHRTEPEEMFEAICKKLSLPFIYTGNAAFWIGDINPDFIDSNGKKVAVDIFGDYWHTPLFRRQALRPKCTEEIRKKTIKEYGWRLVIFWESELELPDAKERVLKKLGAKYGMG